jgi:cytosine/adenosine deaminase-related metal-dependent hydrolase
MAYAGFDENTYYARWCEQRNQKCSEVWPKDCPYVQRETKYAEAMEAYNKRYSAGIENYYAWCENTAKKSDICEAARYAKKCAGPEPKEEDF